jgi:hypothetical protein
MCIASAILVTGSVICFHFTFCSYYVFVYLTCVRCLKQITLPVTRIADAIHILKVLIGDHLHLQDTSKLQCVEDFLEGMLGKLKFE